MLISRCCRDSLVAEIDHYVCENCNRPCDALCSFLANDDDDYKKEFDFERI